MINHVRTLLLNAKAELPNIPGEEYVSPKFKPIKLSLLLRRIRMLLFGTKPSRIAMNYRLRQIMTLLHITELEEYVLKPDPRITYWPQGVSEIRNHSMSSLPEAVLAIEQSLSADDIVELFGDASQEPYATFHSYWKGSDQIAYKLGSVALAVAFRTEEAGVN